MNSSTPRYRVAISNIQYILDKKVEKRIDVKDIPMYNGLRELCEVPKELSAYVMLTQTEMNYLKDSDG